VTWQPSSTTIEDWGRLQVVLGTTDVTFLRGEATQVMSWSVNEPFGDATCELAFPQVTSYETLGVGDLAPFADWADVTINRVRPDGTVAPVWEGLWGSEETNHDEKSGPLVLHCLGVLYQADLLLATPPFSSDPVDVGTLVSAALSHPSFRFSPPARITTGIQAVPQGSWNPRLTGLVQDYLAGTIDAAGDQWTVMNLPGRRASLAHKDRTTVHWTLTVGTQGLNVQLARDLSMAPNAYFGEGQCKPSDARLAQFVALGYWRNSKYPNLHPDSAPVWPGTLITVGHSGSDVLAWTRKMHETGWNISAHSTYTSADAKVCRAFQAKAGISLDGVVGPQTWAATFQPGSNGGSIEGAYIAPIDEDPVVEPYLYNAYGAIIGTNPSFVRTQVRVEHYESFGRATKADATDSAEAERSRDGDAAYQGTLTLHIDPQEGSRFDIRAGQNVKLKHLRGADVLLHVSRADVDFAGGTVNLTVDERARDLPTLEAVRQRYRDTVDPARRQRTPKNRSRIVDDRLQGVDLEAGGGVIPRMGLYHHLVSVIHIPMGEAGTILGVDFALETPAEFSVAIFDRPISPAEITAKGSPGDLKFWGYDNWDENSGLIQAWGEGDTLAGWWPYSPNEDLDPEGNPAAAITGRYFENASTSYLSTKPPWLWVAMWSTVTTYISGRIFPGPRGD
jgi:hypothetical protein